MDCPPGDNKVAIVVERWPLSRGGHCRKFDCIFQSMV